MVYTQQLQIVGGVKMSLSPDFYELHFPKVDLECFGCLASPHPV